VRRGGEDGRLQLGIEFHRSFPPGLGLGSGCDSMLASGTELLPFFQPEVSIALGGPTGAAVSAGHVSRTFTFMGIPSLVASLTPLEEQATLDGSVIARAKQSLHQRSAAPGAPEWMRWSILGGKPGV
jgi:hypothetical protein